MLISINNLQVVLENSVVGLSVWLTTINDCPVRFFFQVRILVCFRLFIVPVIAGMILKREGEVFQPSLFINRAPFEEDLVILFGSDIKLCTVITVAPFSRGQKVGVLF